MQLVNKQFGLFPPVAVAGKTLGENKNKMA